MNGEYLIDRNRITSYSHLVIVEVDQSLYYFKKKLQELIETIPKAKFIAVSNHNCFDDWINLYQWGVSGYVIADQIEEELGKSIFHVRERGIYLPNQLHAQFLTELFKLRDQKKPRYQMLLNKDIARQIFSERECDVYELMIQGKSAQEISKVLYISLSTVNDHTDAIFKILRVNNRARAIVEGIKIGLVY